MVVNVVVEMGTVVVVGGRLVVTTDVGARVTHVVRHAPVTGIAGSADICRITVGDLSVWHGIVGVPADQPNGKSQDNDEPQPDPEDDLPLRSRRLEWNASSRIRFVWRRFPFHDAHDTGTVGVGRPGLEPGTLRLKVSCSTR